MPGMLQQAFRPFLQKRVVYDWSVGLRPSSIQCSRSFTSKPAIRRPRIPFSPKSGSIHVAKGKSKTNTKFRDIAISDAEVINRRAGALAVIPHIRTKVEQLGISEPIFQSIANEFHRDLTSGKLQNVDNHPHKLVLQPKGDKQSIDTVLFRCFLDYAETRLPKDVASKITSLKKITDLRYPQEWYPEARRMQRKIHLHVGPTNSGKTYSALKRLTEAKSGIYCGPLRLLAHEIYERMNDNGISCNLITGEEKRIVSEDAALTSSTVEMVELNRDLEVAVIDEIQMIGDRTRGWAWTQALLGLRAQEIHLCGEASVVPLVKELCEALNDDVQVHHYERLTPLSISKHSLNGNYKNVKKGDCVVTFARKDIFDVKKSIERKTGLRCAVVYGALPPESRAVQARAFNDPDGRFDVLVASDAVGMGLNLNIKRIIFECVQKFDGKSFTFIHPPHLKQIAGRAGRFATTYATGEVTTFEESDLQYVKKAMGTPILHLKSAGVHPTVDIVEMFSAQMPEVPFSEVLQMFEDMANVGSQYFLCTYGDSKVVAQCMDHLELSVRDRYQFISAPTPVRDQGCLEAITKMATAYSENKELTLDTLVKLPNSLRTITSQSKLDQLESSHKIIMLYKWLRMRYPDHFTTSDEETAKIKGKCELLIDEALKKVHRQWGKRNALAIRAKESKLTEKSADS